MLKLDQEIRVNFEGREFTVPYRGEIELDFDYSALGFLLTSLDDISYSDFIGRLEKEAPFCLAERAESGLKETDMLLYPCESVEGDFTDFLRAIDRDGDSTSAFVTHDREHRYSVVRTKIDWVPFSPIGFYEIEWRK